VATGFGADYGSEWSGRYETVDFSLVYISLTPAVSYRWNDKLSFGAGTGITYTSNTSEVKFRQPIGGGGDGKITSDLDGVGLSVTLSMLYEFTPRTRAGIAWTSDSDADLEGNVRLRNLNPLFDQVAAAGACGYVPPIRVRQLLHTRWHVDEVFRFHRQRY
jgi:long-chain fatty acid transport protein